MRTRFRYDHDLDAVVEIRDGSNYFEEKTVSTSVISDDIGAGVNGLRAMHRTDKRHFDSKSAYRADVKAAGLREVGTETNFASTPPARPKDEYGRIVQETYRQFQSNQNGAADIARADIQRSEFQRRNSRS